MAIVVKRVSSDMWEEVEAVLGPDGGDDGCWCMGWRVKEHLPPKEAKDALRRLVEDEGVYALLAFVDGVPVGWSTFGPRSMFYHACVHLQKTERAAPEGWAIPCFFIKPGFRGRGLARQLLAAILEEIQAEGGGLAEAYPFDHKVQDERSQQEGDLAADWAFTGSLKMFEEAGFVQTGVCMNGCLHYLSCELSCRGFGGT